MGFNNGSERRKLNAEWERLRVTYRQAGMSEEAIQAMYEFDLNALNSERAYSTNTVKVEETGDDESNADLINFKKACEVKDTYHETKSSFSWIGEVEDERLLAGLEKLSREDLELLTLYAHEGYTVTEISKVFRLSHQCISVKIKRITNFLKNFNFDVAK